jgi:hypothetical protein
MLTYVAPARTNSIVLERVNSDKIERYKIVDIMIMTIRIDMVLVMLQITTGISKRDTIKDSSITRAIRLIKRPEYRYTFGSTERLK